MTVGAVTLLCRLGLLLLAAGFASPLRAQFLNRATWLGVEGEETRRDFHQGIEYYLDRLSYIVLPPWRERGLPRFRDGVHYRMGSVTSDAFTIEGTLDQTIELGDGVSFGYHMLHSENRDTRFLRNALEFEVGLGPESAVFVQSELLADKGSIDVSIGAWLLRRDDDALRVMLTAVDAPSDKSPRADYSTDAYAVMLAGAFGDPDRHRVTFEIGGQLPLRVRDREAMHVLELHRWIGSIETHLRLGERDWLVGAAEVEWTDKGREPEFGGAGAPEDFRRDFHQLRLEWWRDDGGMPWSIGVQHTGLDEDGLVSYDPASDLRVDRDEWFGIGRLHLAVTERLSFEPQIFAGHVRQTFRDVETDRRVDRFEGKLAWGARWDFSPDATIALQVMAELDEPAFGGGGLQFVARF